MEYGQISPEDFKRVIEVIREDVLNDELSKCPQVIQDRILELEEELRWRRIRNKADEDRIAELVKEKETE